MLAFERYTANHSDVGYVKESIQKLENVDANILGIIFNDVNYKEKSYARSYFSAKYATSKYAHQPQAPKAKKD